MKFLPMFDRGCDGGSCSFYDKDTKERYVKNLKTQPKDWKYRQKIVTYKLNSDYYRTAEFNKIPWSDSIVIFGCSNVFGVGAAIDETLSAQLTKMTGIPAINMGVPGSSPQFSLYNSAILRQVYPKPRAVVFAWTSANRCTLFRYPPHTKKEFYIENCGSWTDDSSDLGKSWSRYDSNIHGHLQMTRITAQQMWSDTKYVDFTLFQANMKYIPDCTTFKIIDHARDCSHPGEETNNVIAKHVATQLGL